MRKRFTPSTPTLGLSATRSAGIFRTRLWFVRLVAVTTIGVCLTLSVASADRFRLEGVARFGGQGSDRVTAMIVDAQGNVFITGSTTSSGLATPGSFQQEIAGIGITGGDAYLAKLDGSTLSPIWVTYLGGSRSENGTDKSGGLALGPGGSIIVAGTTSSDDFPTTPDAIQAVKAGVGEDLFIAQISADGSRLLYGSYLGGSAGELLTGLQRDAGGRLYLTGQTSSTDLPVSANAFQSELLGNQSGFLLRLSSDARTIEYGTYFGGAGNDTANALAVQSPSEVWIGGQTSSTDLPLTSDAFDRTRGGCGVTACDAFLASLDTDSGALNYSTFMGGISGDEILDLALLGTKVLYVVGSTSSVDFPLTNWTVKPQMVAANIPDGFVVKFRTDGRAIAYSTLIGGDRGGERIQGVTTAGGTAFVVGFTGSRDLPETSGGIQTTFGGFIDAFILKVAGDGREITYSTYVGGESFDEAKFISTIRGGGLPIAFGFRTFFILGETNSPSIHDEDPGPRGLSDIFILRLVQIREFIVTPQ